MKSSREKILHTLLTYPGSTINDLANAVGINGISIRHHLTVMEAEDLVTATEERHGVGRPRLTYTLTEKGVEEFPTRYFNLTKRLINALKEKLNPEEITGLFKEIGSNIAKDHQSKLEGGTIQQNIALLQKVLTEEGFVVNVKKDDGAYTLSLLSCPFNQVGLKHPEICAIDYEIISSFFPNPTRIETCILNGDNRCTYHIPLEDKKVTL